TAGDHRYPQSTAGVEVVQALRVPLGYHEDDLFLDPVDEVHVLLRRDRVADRPEGEVVTLGLDPRNDLGQARYRVAVELDAQDRRNLGHHVGRCAGERVRVGRRDRPWRLGVVGGEFELPGGLDVVGQRVVQGGVLLNDGKRAGRYRRGVAG